MVASRARRLALLGAVALTGTVGCAIGGGPVTVADPGDPAVPVSAHAPALPFTVGWLPGGYELQDFAVTPDGVWHAGFGSGDEWISVDLARQPGPPWDGVPVTVAGQPGVLAELSHVEGMVVTWPTPAGTMSVHGRDGWGSRELLLRVAGSVTDRPTPLFPLLVPAVPAGWTVTAWGGSAGGETVTLCPTPEQGPECAHLERLDGDDDLTMRPPPSGAGDLDPDRWAETLVAGTPVRTSPDGRSAYRRGERADLLVTSDVAVPAVLQQVAAGSTTR